MALVSLHKNATTTSETLPFQIIMTTDVVITGKKEIHGISFPLIILNV